MVFLLNHHPLLSLEFVVSTEVIQVGIGEHRAGNPNYKNKTIIPVSYTMPGFNIFPNYCLPVINSFIFQLSTEGELKSSVLGNY